MKMGNNTEMKMESNTETEMGIAKDENVNNIISCHAQIRGPLPPPLVGNPENAISRASGNLRSPRGYTWGFARFLHSPRGNA